MRTLNFLTSLLAMTLFCGIVAAQPVSVGVDMGFTRGDSNLDDMVNLGDVIGTLGHLFEGNPTNCQDALDANDDGGVNLGDAIYTLSFLFSAGAPPPPPFAQCGVDPTADALGCDGPTGCGPVSTGPPVLSSELFFQIAPEIQAFAIQLYDDFSGQPLPLQWIDDPFVAQSIQLMVQPSSFHPGGLTNDATATTYIQTMSGELFLCDLVDIVQGQPGKIVFTDGYFELDPEMHAVIETEYGLTGYTSAGEKAKEKECGGDAACEDWEEDALIADPIGVWVWTEVTLVVYQDDPGKSWNKDYATASAAGDASVVTVEANGQNSIVNKLRELAGECKKVKCMVFAVHGTSGSFRIGPKGTPFDSPTRVGGEDDQRSATEFGEAIAPYLAAGSQITLLSCGTAEGSGGTGFIQDLADASGSTVVASDDDVTIDDDEASSEGSLHTATADGDSTSSTGEAAGEIDPCP